MIEFREKGFNGPLTELRPGVVPGTPDDFVLSRAQQSRLLVHHAVANGFPPELYSPLYREIRLNADPNWMAVSFPPRPLWIPTPVPGSLVGWNTLAQDWIHAWEGLTLPPAIAVGHSFGGVASLLVSIDRPDLIRALVLLDPTVFSRSISRKAGLVRFLRRLGVELRIPIVERALRRRRDFPSREEAYRFFAEKRLFSDWPSYALRLYVDHGLVPVEGGAGFTLRWSPEWEAQCFRTLETRIWARFRDLSQSIPVLILRGQRSDVFTRDVALDIQKELPHAQLEEVPNAGHLFPISHPQETAQLISKWLSNRIS